MKLYILLIICCITICSAGCCQTNGGRKELSRSKDSIGGKCEGCEAIYESPIPFEKLNNIDTLPDFREAGPRIELSGTIYQADGRTPAKNVVLYVYHTDQQGNYSNRGNETGWGKRHGYIRGWIKTNGDGAYKFYTLVPASYPNSNNPKHIHCTIREEGKNAYWIDEYVFDDDPNLTAGKRNTSDAHGGSGILKTNSHNGMLRASRDIILGKNIPGYPVGK